MVLEQKLTPGGGSTIPEHFIIGTIKVCIESNRVFALSQAEMGVYCNIWDISDGNLAVIPRPFVERNVVVSLVVY